MKRLPDTHIPEDGQAITGRHQRGSALISFVGAGPGSADLLTVRAIRVLAQADVVLFDSLGCQEALSFCPQAKQIAVGKRAGGTSCEQIFINQELVAQAQAGQHVVRLKGGDPTIFGRLDEEISAATAAAIPYQIVPGITAASAAAANAGVTLTQRGVARSVTLATPAVGRGEAANPGWAQAATTGSTVAVYMAGNQLAKTVRQLITAGFSTDTPVIIARGVATAAETFTYSHVGSLAIEPPTQLTEPGKVPAPCLLLVGEAVRQRKQDSQITRQTGETVCTP